MANYATALSRPIMIRMAACGATVIVKRSQPTPGYLPVFSTATRAEAEALQVALCHLDRTDNETYRLPFSGKIGDMKAVTDMLADVHRLRGEGKDAWARFADYKRAFGLGLESKLAAAGIILEPRTDG